MNNRDRICLEYILEHYQELISTYKQLKDYDDFMNNYIFRKAIVFDFIQIGENINKLEEEVRNKINKVDIRGIVDFRNRLVHGYGDIDFKIVWNAVSGSLPRLVNQVKQILNDN